MKRVAVVLLILAAIFLGSGIKGLRDHAQPHPPAVDHQERATPEDALINEIDRRMEMDQLREGKAGR